MNDKKKLWFKRKRYGWGWTPATWEGWLVILLYSGFIVWNFTRLDAVSHSASDTIRPFFIYALFATALLLFICFTKGERPRWQWGEDRGEDK